MLINFLSSCKTILNGETDDFKTVVDRLVRTPVSVGLMPAIIDDFYPVYSLACTSAAGYVSPDVYIVSVSDTGKRCFEKMVNNFYQDDLFREQFQIELEEMILLDQPDLNDSFCLNNDVRCNVIYCGLTMPNDRTAHLLIMPTDPAGCWELMERYGIKCDVLIDSHKGLGNWFEDIPLYGMMRETRHTEFLPRYYFRGLFISHEPPEGFKLIYTIPEPIGTGADAVESCFKEIYKIDWEENRRN